MYPALQLRYLPLCGKDPGGGGADSAEKGDQVVRGGWKGWAGIVMGVVRIPQTDIEYSNLQLFDLNTLLDPRPVERLYVNSVRALMFRSITDARII